MSTGEEADDRLEAAEQRVTALLQQVDNNINRATDSAARLITDAREFAGHAKKAQASIEVWVEFFRSFEECERRKFFAGQHEGDPNTTASKLDVTADSLPSFFISPRTPCLDDSMRAGFKRRYGSPGMVGDTPSFGCSPPKSVKMRHHNEASVDDSIEKRLSPVGQPVFPRQNHDSSFKFDDSMEGGSGGANHLEVTTSAAVCGDVSMESMPTPKMSSPTRTIQVDEVEFETWKQAQPQGGTSSSSSSSSSSAPAAAAAPLQMSTPPAAQNDAMSTPVSGLRRSARNATPAKSGSKATSATTPASGGGTPRSGARGARGARGTPKSSAGRKGTPRRGRQEPEEEEEEVDESVSKLPPLVLKTLPPVFRVGAGSKQIQKVYSLFGCRPSAHGDDYPTLEFGDVVRKCSALESDRVRLLLDSLVSKRILHMFENESGSQLWQFAGKEN